MSEKNRTEEFIIYGVPVMTRRGTIRCEMRDGIVNLPSWVEKPDTPTEPHELDLIVLPDEIVDGRPAVRCRGGVDSRPGLEMLAKTIRERDNAVKEMTKQKELRLKAEHERDEARDKLKLWQQFEVSRRNVLVSNGLYGPPPLTVPHAGA